MALDSHGMRKLLESIKDDALRSIAAGALAEVGRKEEAAILQNVAAPAVISGGRVFKRLYATQGAAPQGGVEWKFGVNPGQTLIYRNLPVAEALYNKLINHTQGVLVLTSQEEGMIGGL